MPTPLRFFNSSNFSVPDQTFSVPEQPIKCWYAFSWLECKEHFGNKIILICRNYFVFVSPALHMLSTERRRYGVHVLFGDVSYDVRSAHWRANKKKVK